MSQPSKVLSVQAADDILSMITIKKKFSLGDKLPNENELSAMLGISRTTLREAIKLLVARNVLEIQRGKGTYVANIKNSDDDAALDPLFKSKMRIKDLFEVRLMIEPSAARLAAIRGTDREIKRILDAGAAVEEKIFSGKNRVYEEQNFHNSIILATGNEFMNMFMPIVIKGVQVGVNEYLSNEEVTKSTLEEHRNIMFFIKERNSDGAEAAMEMHILDLIRITRSMMGNR
ncbi:MAG: FadR/GntR family transcriptional regulator [Lachnospiraceae bacterium]|nr:FadR/GntR family transcriptional regulator [Lachnospiraceae bacterium]